MAMKPSTTTASPTVDRDLDFYISIGFVVFFVLNLIVFFALIIWERRRAPRRAAKILAERIEKSLNNSKKSSRSPSLLVATRNGEVV